MKTGRRIEESFRLSSLLGSLPSQQSTSPVLIHWVAEKARFGKGCDSERRRQCVPMRTWVVNSQWRKGEREGRRERRRLRLLRAKLWIPSRPCCIMLFTWKGQMPHSIAPSKPMQHLPGLRKTARVTSRTPLCSSAIISEDKPVHDMPVCPSLSLWFPVLCRISSNFMLLLTEPSTLGPLAPSLTSSLTVKLLPLLYYSSVLKRSKYSCLSAMVWTPPRCPSFDLSLV